MKKPDSLSKSALIYTMTGFTSKGISFVLLPFYSYYFTAAEFGIISLMLAVYTVASVFFQFGIQSVFPKFYLDSPDGQKPKVTGFFFLRYCCWTTFLFLSGLLASGWISELVHANGSYAVYYRWLFAALWVESVALVAIQYFKTEMLAGKAGLLQLLYTISQTLLVIVLLLAGLENISAVIYAQVCAAVLQFGAAAMLTSRQISFGRIEQNLNKIILFAAPIVLGSLFSVLMDVADRFLLAYYLSEKEVGIYSFGYRIALGMQVFVMAFRAAWTPLGIRLVKSGEYTERSGVILRQLSYALLFFFLMILMTAKAAFYPFAWTGQLFSAEYTESAMIIPIIALAYLLNAYVSYFSIFPYITEKSGYFLAMDLIGIVVNLLLNIVLIPVMGLWGAGLATLVSYTSVLIYISISSGKYNPEKLSYRGFVLPGIILTASIIMFYIPIPIGVVIPLFLVLLVYVVQAGKFSVTSLFSAERFLGISKKTD